ncbi:MAG TPA: histidine--tRNA ligase [Nitrospira sp.]|jgi:histidyl-tRNA synthetase|nr:histidine--tRNA ligase [Nitrospira sp.]MCC7472018.1 histidine--tRNA ligase [Candidatus Nomurabacteria bacterium]MBS0157703.1 histidine--tRNA ligase [Nitrospira sp.]HNI67570.1 histidine--tRNA ligase [Nitrospira sp.]HNK14266.1 histidine--tRNA ligase [Nitrospira sp.]
MIKAIKGVKDLLPEESPRWRFIEDTGRRWAQRYGFQEIRVPIFETTTLFARSIGATTDIVEKEMYTFADRDGSSLTLRPEGTAGTVRAFIEHNRAADPRPQKFYYTGPMFRHERPQAGRLRQFHQFGVESFGIANPRADVEVISLLWRLLSDLSLPGLTLEINNLGYSDDRARYKPLLVAFLKSVETRLCANCQRRIEGNPLRVLDCKVPDCRSATEDAPRLADSLSPAARDHFACVTAGLQSVGIPFDLNPRLVRGLDYYCLTAFEVTCSHLGAQNAVGAGGRYDGLVEQLGGPAVPAVGFAVGLERIALMMPDAVIVPSAPRIYVAAFGTKAVDVGCALLDELRQAGVPADMDFRSTSLKAHLRQADRLGALYTILLGDDEIEKGTATLRNMQTKAQEDLPLRDLVSSLQGRLRTPESAPFSS